MTISCDSGGTSRPTACLAGLALLQLLHRPVSVINRTVGIGVCTGIGIRDRQPSKRFACHFARSFRAVQPELVEQRIVFISVTVRPAVDGDLQNVPSGIESSRAEDSLQLIP